MVEFGPCIEVHIDRWDQARNIARRMGAYWLFRGQADATWPLSTVFERKASGQIHPEEWEMREYLILRAFQRRAFHFIDAPPGKEEDVEWLALLRHYGGPTRLLDVTASFYIAAFFATEGVRDVPNAAIWAFNKRLLAEHFFEKYAGVSAGTHDEAIQVAIKQEIAEFLWQRLERGPTRILAVKQIEPFRQNERLAAQQGSFLMPLDIRKSFEGNVLPREEPFPTQLNPQLITQNMNVNWMEVAERTAIVKMVVPQEVAIEAVFDLRSMNITASTMFPGLDGFARSLDCHLLLPKAGFEPSYEEFEEYARRKTRKLQEETSGSLEDNQGVKTSSPQPSTRKKVE